MKIEFVVVFYNVVTGDGDEEGGIVAVIFIQRHINETDEASVNGLQVHVAGSERFAFFNDGVGYFSIIDRVFTFKRFNLHFFSATAAEPALERFHREEWAKKQWKTDRSTRGFQQSVCIYYCPFLFLNQKATLKLGRVENCKKRVAV